MLLRRHSRSCTSLLIIIHFFLAVEFKHSVCTNLLDAAVVVVSFFVPTTTTKNDDDIILPPLLAMAMLLPVNIIADDDIWVVQHARRKKCAIFA